MVTVKQNSNAMVPRFTYAAHVGDVMTITRNGASYELEITGVWDTFVRVTIPSDIPVGEYEYSIGIERGIMVVTPAQERTEFVFHEFETQIVEHN